MTIIKYFLVKRVLTDRNTLAKPNFIRFCINFFA